MPSYPKKYFVAYMSDSGRRQLGAFSTEELRNAFQQYIIEDLVATKFGDWYELPNGGAVNDGNERVQHLNGQLYNLPTGERFT
jgi:hypothetical protein